MGSWTAPILVKRRLISVSSAVSSAISSAVTVPRVVRRAWARVIVRRTWIKRIERSWVIIRRIKWRSRARIIRLSFIIRYNLFKCLFIQRIIQEENLPSFFIPFTIFLMCGLGVCTFVKSDFFYDEIPEKRIDKNF